MGEIITFDREAKKKILEGALLFEKIIKTSLDANVIVYRKGGLVSLTRDTLQIVKMVRSKDRLEDFAIRMIREGAVSVQAILLCCALVREGLESILSGADPNQIKQKLSGDVSVFKRDPVVALDVGYVSPYFVTNPEKMVCELESPYVYVTHQKLETPFDVIPILEGHQGSLLIVAEEISFDALRTLVINRIKGKLPIAAIQGSRKERALIASGQVDKVYIDKQSTTITGGHESPALPGDALKRAISTAGLLLTLETMIITS